MQEQELKKLERFLQAKYPVGVPRKHIGEATGYVLNPGTCANLDSQGEGIPGRYKIGRQTVYPVDGIIVLLKSKMFIEPWLKGEGMIDKKFDEIVRTFGGQIQSDGSFNIHCPVDDHEDKTPSCNVKKAGDKILVHCFGGCSQDAIISALKSRHLWPQKVNGTNTAITMCEMNKINHLHRVSKNQKQGGKNHAS